ncbi:Glutathione S-transferase-like protein gedE like [Verticillium longisporum]|nr:Glutathione S-transferase-like protein gedE like [Verticillium longisporum]
MSSLKPITLYGHAGPNPCKVAMILEELGVPYETENVDFSVGSGQGPYFGQAVWFAKYHPEDLPSAKERYVEQTVRVLSVLDKLLEGKEYLVGNKCTYADIAFVNWNATAENVILKSDWDEKVEKKYPNFVAWHRRVTERPIIKDVLQRQAAGR